MIGLEDSLFEFERALLGLDSEAARRVLNLLPRDIAYFQNVERLVVSSLESIGVKWERGTVALSQVYMSGRICEDLLDVLFPPGAVRREHQPKIALAVLADHHLLGKRILSSTLRASGYVVLDYGHGVGAEDLADRTIRDGVEILLISTLMLSSALKVKEVTARLRAAQALAKVVVGGAPFLYDDQLWRAVGADAMGRSATDAPRLVEELSRGGTSTS